jgi:hypothetical protein
MQISDRLAPHVDKQVGIVLKCRYSINSMVYSPCGGFADSKAA